MTTDTRTLLLKEAETLMRTRGYAAFSYADLAERIGIRKASIHHHFPTKESLGAALIDGYLEKFRSDLGRILVENDTAEKRLQHYAGFFIASLHGGMMPLCGALSAEIAALPESLQSRVRDFFELHLDWLAQVVREGVKAKEINANLKPKQAARLILSVLEGASLSAWALGQAGFIKPTVDELFAELRA